MMAAANTVSDLQAVDFGFGRVLVAAYEGLAPAAPQLSAFPQPG